MNQSDPKGGLPGGEGPPLPLRPPPRRKPVFEPEETPELTPEQRQELRQALERERARLAESINDRQHQERDVGREVGDEMDEATFEGATAMTSRLLERDVHLLSEINHALSKFADGTYGLCEGTGEPISYERLRSRPWARYSISHQEEIEREARTRGGP